MPRRRRWFAEAVQGFHLDALSSIVGLKVDFDLQITSTLFRLLAEKVGAGYEHAQLGFDGRVQTTLSLGGHA